MSSATGVEVWTVEELVRASGSAGDAEKKRHIEIPKFQRSVVWSNSQKQRLVDTLVDGMPVGAVLLYKHGKSDRLEDAQGAFTKFLLIDGLQRCTALREHFASPTKAFRPEKIPLELLSSLSKEFRDKPIDDIRLHVADWIRSLSGWDLSSNYTPSALLKAIAPKLAPELGSEATNALIANSAERLNAQLESIKRFYDISARQIPVIVYSGPSKDLPLIFERLNHSGTQLNKYQIFAASWQSQSVDVRDPAIESKVISKYRALIEQGYEIDNFDATATSLTPLNYYEYLFGFGKTLSDAFPTLFRDKVRDPDDIESVGFNLTGLCVSCSLKELGSLPEKAKPEELPALRKAIEESSTVVHEVLRPVLGLKANSRGNTVERAKFHTEFQICSYVAAVFRAEYESGSEGGKTAWQSKKGARRSRAALQGALLGRFLSESIQNFWSGTGDEKAMAAASDGAAFRPVSRMELDASLNQWIARDLERKDRKRYLPPESELVLRYYYAKRWNAFAQLNSDRFDLEHLIPVDRMKLYMGSENERGRPINALGNLCFLSQGPNRSKKESTYYEWLDEQMADGFISDAEHQTMSADFARAALVTREELDQVLNAGVSQGREAFWESYFEFARARATKLSALVAHEYTS